MKDVNLCDFSEITLVGDMKYLRFIDKKSDKLYLIEDYNPVILEDKVEKIKNFKNIEELKKYFNNSSSRVFEFISAKDMKYYLDTIKAMSDIEKKQLTEIVKQVRNMQITYINFTYFFFETFDKCLYYSHINKKTGKILLKNLKIINVIKPADIDVIIRDIKAYGAFKYHGNTIKYEDIKEYIDNMLLNPDAKYEWLIKNLRDKMSSEKVLNKIKETHIAEDLKSIDDKKEKVDSIIKKEKDDKPKEKKKKNNLKEKKHGFKNSIWMYCLIGFTAGVLLAAITIIIGTIV